MMDKAEVRDGIQVLGSELIKARRGAPVKIVYTVTGLYQNLVSTCFIHKADLNGDPEGLIVPVKTSHDSLHIASFIREHSYVAGKGTWFTMRFVINADDAAEITFDFDKEPLSFGESLGLELYVNELKKFPVMEPHKKEWLKSKS